MNRLRLWIADGWLAALAGVMAATGQAPWGLWPLALAGYALVTLLVAHAPDRWSAVRRSWMAGAGHFGLALVWIVEPFFVDPARDGWMAPFAVAFMVSGMALFWALAGGLSRIGGGPAARACLFALGLGLADLLRTHALTGFPWALAGHIWIDTPVVQFAALAGPVGLTVLTMALAASPVAGRAWRPVAGTTLGLGAALAAGAAVWAWGDARLAQPDPPRDPAIRVRLVQPNATQALKWQPGMWQTFLDRQIEASAAPSARPLDLVVWPETAVPYLLEDADGLIADALAASGGVPVALGIQRADGLRYFNSLVAIGLPGSGPITYDKVHLVPFGEFVPFGDALARLGIGAFAAQAGHGYTAGMERALLDLGKAGRVLPLICYEAVFPQDLRAFPGRADWILQVTNDGWFGALAGPYQHLAQARLRAVEQGLPFLRAANTGITAIIDARGRVVQSQPLDTVGWLDADVPPSLPLTAYAAFGDGPVTILLATGFIAGSLARRRK